MDHDVGDFELVQVEQRTEAVTVLLECAAVAMKIGDRAAKFLMRGTLRCRAHQLVAEAGKQAGAKNKRKRHQKDDAGENARDDPAVHPGRFSFRKDNTSEDGTSLAMKAWPTPRVRMKVSAPRVTFLSCAI